MVPGLKFEIGVRTGRTARLVRWLGNRLPRNGRLPHEALLGSGCHVYVNLYVCKHTHDTGENPAILVQGKFLL
ncbi:hypothetical protein SFRURICE_005933 [Spodoptera frugiperda]|nr:hypothetical protein SFRURICE_005933 [Spodoptera frugiperda]